MYNPFWIKRITLVTDAWSPQTNGVVTTLKHLTEQAKANDIVVDVIHPDHYQHFPMPFYPEIAVVWRAKCLEERVLAFQPDAIHIATEGPLGWRVRRICMKYGLPFTTGYHTKFAEYVHQRFTWLPENLGYKFLRKFHRPATRTLVPTYSVQQELETNEFQNLEIMSRGINRQLFNPNKRQALKFNRPVYLSVGRLSVEKNLDAFLSLSLPGTKLVIGDGPERKRLEKRYPDTIFLGEKFGEDLARFYASADVFVFPSLTDTFGNVNLEAIASGLPVAAFPVTGPKNIITQGINGSLQQDLAVAIEQAMQIPRTGIEHTIPQYRWEKVFEQFLGYLAPIHSTEQEDLFVQTIR